MKYTIDISYEMADKILVDHLKETKKCFEMDLARGDANIFFWEEPEKDKAEIQRHIDAIDLILDWYAIPGEE